MKIILNVGSMAFSDLIVLQALSALLEEHGPDAIISQTMISEASGVSWATTQRALYRLMRTGRLVGHFRRGVGYQYRIPDEQALHP